MSPSHSTHAPTLSEELTDGRPIIEKAHKLNSTSSPSEGDQERASHGVESYNYKAALTNLSKYGATLIVTFWLVALWLFGSYNAMGSHVHQLGCIVLDADGGSVGE